MTRRTRTYLAVPAHRSRLVLSAANSPADAVFLDLEDAVPLEEKTAALASARDALSQIDWGTKTVSVRVNALESGLMENEITVLAPIERLDAFIIPKAESVGLIAKVAEHVERSRRARREPPELELLIETARGLMNVDALAAVPQVSALHLGVGDLAASLGARAIEIGQSPSSYRHVGSAADGHPSILLDFFAYPMMRLLVAARAHGLRAIDGPCGAFQDQIVTQASAVKAAAMGFDGKQVIHPTQIDITREAFIPTPAEVSFAERIVAALDAAGRNGNGAATVDGRMIDFANVRMAKRLLNLAGKD